MQIEFSRYFIGCSIVKRSWRMTVASSTRPNHFSLLIDLGHKLNPPGSNQPLKARWSVGWLVGTV